MSPKSQSGFEGLNNASVGIRGRFVTGHGEFGGEAHFVAGVGAGGGRLPDGGFDGTNAATIFDSFMLNSAIVNPHLVRMGISGRVCSSDVGHHHRAGLSCPGDAGYFQRPNPG